MICHKRFRDYLVVWALIMIFAPVCRACPKRIIVKNQSEFNDLQSQVTKFIEGGCNNIKIILRPGVYYYQKKHITLQDVNKPKLTISIQGDATLFPIADNHSPVTPYRSLFVGDASFTPWTEMFSSNGKITIVDSNDKEFKLCRSDSEEISVGDFVLVTKWYTSGIYKIIKFDKTYIYFEAPDTRYREQYGDYDINYDYIYKKEYPRYKLFIKSQIPMDCYCCGNSQFLYCNNCVVKSLTIKGVHFVGGANEPLLQFEDVKAEKLYFSDCAFRDLMGDVIYGKNSNVFFVNNCLFQNCASDVIRTDNQTHNMTIISCKFESCGQHLSSPSCIVSSGINYTISNNIFVDFYGRALTLGAYFSMGMNTHSSGMVKENEFYYTDEFFNSASHNLLMDNGAIYVNTINDELIIKNNYIHNIAGAGDNNGVFMDDGARNTNILGNIIINTPTGHAISSRRVKSVEELAGETNVGNVIRDNFIGGNIRFEGREESNNDCEIGTNYILSNGVVTTYNNKLENVSITGDYIPLTYVRINSSQIELQKTSYSDIDYIPARDWIKKYIVEEKKK